MWYILYSSRTNILAKSHFWQNNQSDIVYRLTDCGDFAENNTKKLVQSAYSQLITTDVSILNNKLLCYPIFMEQECRVDIYTNGCRKFSWLNYNIISNWSEKQLFIKSKNIN